jgi:hypothetical protein
MKKGGCLGIAADSKQWPSGPTRVALATLNLLTSLRLANATLLARLSRVSPLPAKVFVVAVGVSENQDLFLIPERVRGRARSSE